MAKSSIYRFGYMLAAAFILLNSPGVYAETIKWGVNAAVGSFATLYETQESYKPVVEKIRSDTGLKIETRPLYSSFVRTALERETFDLLLVHTNDAAPFLKGNRYVLVALSDDSEDNRITFITKKGATAKTLSDFAGKCVVSTGSFGTAIARVILKKAAVHDQLKSFKYVRDGEAIPFFLNNHFCDVGATRSSKLIQTLERAGGTVVYRSAPFPVYALIASKRMDPAVIGKIKASLSTFDSADGANFTAATKIRRFAPPDHGTPALLAVFD